MCTYRRCIPAWCRSGLGSRITKSSRDYVILDSVAVGRGGQTGKLAN